MAKLVTQRQLDDAASEFQRMTEEERENPARIQDHLHPRSVAVVRLGMASLQAFRQVIFSPPRTIRLEPRPSGAVGCSHAWKQVIPRCTAH